jgi:hypothetical protein
MKVCDGYLIRDFLLEELAGDIECYASIRLKELDDVVRGRILSIYKERVDLFVSLVAEALKAEEGVVEMLKCEYAETGCMEGGYLELDGNGAGWICGE